MIRQILIDDILCAEVLIRIRFGMVRDCIDGLSHVTVWLGLSTEDLSPRCSDKLNKAVLWMVSEASPKIEIASIKQLWQLKKQKKKLIKSRPKYLKTLLMNREIKRKVTSS